jgi:rRNA maturation protein Nop10
MDYGKVYESLIKKAVKRGSKREKGENQHHHIFPKVLGGLKTPENMVFLYHREHFIAHLLLVKIYPGNWGLARAAFMMSKKKNVKSRKYEWLRKEYSKILSENNVFRDFWKMSAVRTGKKRGPQTEEWKKKRLAAVSVAMRGKKRPRSLDTSEKCWIHNECEHRSKRIILSEIEDYLLQGWDFGRGIIKRKKSSEETKSKQSVAQNAVPLVRCPHCGKSNRPQHDARFHGDRCRDRMAEIELRVPPRPHKAYELKQKTCIHCGKIGSLSSPLLLYTVYTHNYLNIQNCSKSKKGGYSYASYKHNEGCV